jgi:hypothetical protein
MYVTKPSNLEGVAVWMGHRIVFLPADGKDMALCSRLAAAISRNSTIDVSGQQYRWPAAPSYSLDVVPFDSPLDSRSRSSHPA